MKKAKVINDPVHGFVQVPTSRIQELIDHPHFQRLRRIGQMGLASLVYPGALHTRFHHAIGAMHLMRKALDSLRAKGHRIAEEEYGAALMAILLHDLGHGPFSHALEKILVEGIRHETLSQALMDHFVRQGRIPALVTEIFCDRYPRPFLHRLVSGQLDMDRLDYLQRDCFYTDVKEGGIGAERIIQLLDLHEGQIVVREKGVYNIEHFLNARRLMYWQVYLHKTALGAEQMLRRTVRRARQLAREKPNAGLFPGCSEALDFFLKNSPKAEDLQDPHFIQSFVALDDHDIWAALKQWCGHRDPVLSLLSQMLLNRRLFATRFCKTPPSERDMEAIRGKIRRAYGLGEEESRWFCFSGSVSNKGYVLAEENILIKQKNGKILDVTEASDLPNIRTLTQIVTKNYLCHADWTDQ